MASPAADLQKLNQANNQFTKSIYEHLRGTEGKQAHIFMNFHAILSLEVRRQKRTR